MTKATYSRYGPSKALIKAIRFLLRPLVKLMLSNQITYTYIIKLLKETYVEVAEHDYQIEGKKQTDSRISLISGVHRRDVKALRGSTFNYDDDLPVGISLGGHLVARWCAHDLYLDEEKKPRPLPRLSKKGNDVSFESLVRSINKDIRPRSVLDELLRLNVVHICDDDDVWLHREVLISDEGQEEKAFYLGMNLHDHIAVCTHNLNGEHPSMLERCLYYDNLTVEDVENLAENAKKMGMEMLQVLNQKALELQKKSENKKDASKRINYGIYFMQGEMSDFEFNASLDNDNKNKQDKQT